MPRWLSRRVLASASTLAFAVAGFCAVVVAGATPAAAAESRQVVTAEIPREEQAKVIVRLPVTRLTAGQPRFFYGRYAATSRYGLMMAAQLVCTVNGRGYTSVTSTMNHRGAELDPFARVISVRWLFVPPVTGDYNCRLIGYAKTDDTEVPPDAKLVVVPGANTLFGMHDDVKAGALEWRDPDSYLPPVEVANPVAYVFDDSTWTADPGARRLDVRADVEVTAVSTGGDRPFAPLLTLTAQQLGGDGCGTATATVDPGEIVTHHYKVQLTTRATISTATGCTRAFDVKVKVQYRPWPQPGHTRHGGRVEGGRYSNLILRNA
ncbi:hypothetical protein RB614_11540 [Phytohabitans sp. ZYX-F-186]|uniref:Ig-like domain-containing protein n=1 Tax=Phytohabitans maris TaxID=3071409 RepID=A0ABU0ZDP0_9ACTN|nr:hypothetical protein [Phytohabitans sp. ZYX-F-186]MDQ7905155.1 hypothetical protein [Phytohabitans sp. ZYX-F-186]